MPRLNGYFTSLAAAIILTILTSCSPLSESLGTAPSPAETTGPNTLWPVGSAPYTPDEPVVTHITPGNHPCEGSAGSIIKPLAPDQCVLNAMLLPMASLVNGLNALAGEQDNTGIYHTDLPNIRNYYVPQLYPKDCWAAALQITRSYLKLHPITQQQLVNHAYSVCPTLNSQRYGATLYQIYYTMQDELEKYDNSIIYPHFCDESKCIVFSLISGQPVIILMHGHALVMVGADWEKLSETNALILRARVLDPRPESGNKILTLSSYQLCDADAFISY